MADNEKIIAVGFKAEPGNAPQQAEQAGKQTADAFVRGANEALKKLDVAGKFKAEAVEGGKSFLDNLFDKSKVDAAAKTVSDSFSAVMPKVGQFQSPVTKEVLSDIERSTLGINAFLTGMRAFATYFDKDASMLAIGQLGAQAFEYGQRYRRAQADAAVAARAARAEATVSRASSMDIVAEMSGAGGLRGAASAFGGGALESGAFGAGAAAGTTALTSTLTRLGAVATEAAGVIGTGIAVVTAAVKARNAIIDTAQEGAEKITHEKFLRNIMGATPRDMDELRFGLRQVGVQGSEVDNVFYRLAIRARRSMPEITHEVEDSSDKQVLANIRVQKSERALAEAQDNVVLAVDRARVAHGNLIKVQQTEERSMDVQRRGAELAVSQAQLGERAAQMRATTAAINLRFAPEQARIADIQGPTTVEGARLGAQGARIALEEARARYYGEEPSEDLQERKRAHALQVARNNADQADVAERQAQLNERKRVAEKAAGVGPEAQAQLAAQQAQQGQELAALQVQRTEIAREIVQIEQDNKNYAAREREARAASEKANRGIGEAVNEAQTAQAESNQAKRDETRLSRKNIEQIQKGIFGGAGLGFPISDVDPEALRKAIIREGGFTVKGQLDALRKFRESQAVTGLPEDQQRQEVFFAAQSLSGLRGGMGGAEQLTELVMRRRAVPKEVIKLWDQRALAQTPEEVEKVEKQIEEYWTAQAVAAENVRVQKGRQRRTALGVGAKLAKQKGEDEEFWQWMIAGSVRSFASADDFLESVLGNKPIDEANKRLRDVRQRKADINATPGFTPDQFTPDLSEARKRVDEIKSSGGGWADAITSAINQLVQAIRGGASKVDSAKPATEGKPAAPSAGGTVNADEILEAEGGLLHGLGSGTSDQIPIMASPGEYVVNAEAVSNPGVLSLLEQINAGKYQDGGMVTGLDMALHDSEREWSRAASTGPMKTLLDSELRRSEQEWRQAVKTSPMVTGLDLALRQAEAGWAAAVRTTGMRTGLDEALQQAEDNWRKSVKSHFQSGGAVATGPAPDATIMRNPYVSSPDVSYQERVLMEHQGFNPDNPDDVKRWRQTIGMKIKSNLGMPGGPTGGGAVARGQIARGAAPPILILKPGVGEDYTIPTPAGGAQVKYNPLAGTHWPEGSGKPYDERDQTTFGKPGVKFDPMNSSTWSPGYMNDFYRAPGYTDIKTSDKDLATPIHFGRRTGDPVLDATIPRSKEAQDKFPEGSWYKFDDGWFRQGPGDHVLRQPGPPPADNTNQVFSFSRASRLPEDEPAKIQQMIDTSRDEERKRIEESQNKYEEAAGGMIKGYADGGAIMPIRVMKGPAAGVIETTQSALEYARAEWRRTHGDEKPDVGQIDTSATGGLIRRYFGGGRVGMQAGGFPPAPDMGGWITQAALHDLSDRLGHIPSSGRGLTPSASALAGLNTLGVHQLDLRTNAGNFPAAVSEETWAAIQRTSLMNQVSSIGSRPSWYS